MKLAPRDVAAYVKRPDPQAAGCLIFGDDAMRVALRRQEFLASLLGPDAEAEMRLTRLAAADLRGDPAALSDAVKAVGFFPGPRAVFVEGASDGLAPIFAAAFEDWQAGDAQIVATAGRLTAKSDLRKLFEAHPSARAAAIYDDPPSRPEIEAMLAAAGLGDVTREAWGDLETLARTLQPGDFRQTVEKLGLYMHGAGGPVTPADLAAVAPQTVEAETDDILHATAESDQRAIGPILARLKGQGVAPVTLCIFALRHFRALHAAACHPKGAAAGLQAQRPPVFGPRRDRMLGQVQRWGRDNLEQAIRLLVETDLTLRSAQSGPQMAIMERTLIRLAMLPGRRTGRN